MSDQLTTICPWCSTEIAWDEEIGPEEQCPHCLNELGEYRSVPLLDEESDFGEEEQQEQQGVSEQDLPEESARDEELYTMSAYEAAFRPLLDSQEVLADCMTCGQEMIHMGQLPPTIIGTHPISMAGWKRPLLDGRIELDAFLCPICFRVDMKLTDPARAEAVKQLTLQAEEPN